MGPASNTSSATPTQGRSAFGLLVLTSVLGATAGGATSVAFSAYRSTARDAHERKASGRDALPLASAGLRHSRGRQRRPTARFVRPPARVLPIEASGSAPRGDDPGFEEPEPAVAWESQRENRVKWGKWRDERIDEHGRELRDVLWAPVAERALQDDLALLQDDGVLEASAIDCRSSLCRATVRYEDFADAPRNAARILHHMYGINCGVEVYAPRPEDPSGEFEATVIFDCSEARAKE